MPFPFGGVEIMSDEIRQRYRKRCTRCGKALRDGQRIVHTICRRQVHETLHEACKNLPEPRSYQSLDERFGFRG